MCLQLSFDTDVVSSGICSGKNAESAKLFNALDCNPTGNQIPVTYKKIGYERLSLNYGRKEPGCLAPDVLHAADVLTNTPCILKIC